MACENGRQPTGAGREVAVASLRNELLGIVKQLHLLPCCPGLRSGVPGIDV